MTEKDYYHILGGKISSLRNSKSVNQEELANFLNISRPSVGNIEKGRQKPSVFLLQQIADYFGLTINDLLPTTPKKIEWMRAVGDNKALLTNKSVTELYKIIVSKK